MDISLISGHYDYASIKA